MYLSLLSGGIPDAAVLTCCEEHFRALTGYFNHLWPVAHKFLKGTNFTGNETPYFRSKVTIFHYVLQEKSS